MAGVISENETTTLIMADAVLPQGVSSRAEAAVTEVENSLSTLSVKVPILTQVGGPIPLLLHYTMMVFELKRTSSVCVCVCVCVRVKG